MISEKISDFINKEEYKSEVARENGLAARLSLLTSEDNERFSKVAKKLHGRQHIVCINMPIIPIKSFPFIKDISLEDMLTRYSPVINMTDGLTSDFFEAFRQTLRHQDVLIPDTLTAYRSEKQKGKTWDALYQIMRLFNISIANKGYTVLYSSYGYEKLFDFCFILQESVGSQTIKKQHAIQEAIHNAYKFIRGVIEYEDQVRMQIFSEERLINFAYSPINIRVTGALEYLADSANYAVFHRYNTKSRDINRFMRVFHQRVEKTFILPVTASTGTRRSDDLITSITAALSKKSGFVTTKQKYSIQQLLAEMQNCEFQYHLASEMLQDCGWKQFLDLQPQIKFQAYSDYAAERLGQVASLIEEMQLDIRSGKLKREIRAWLVDAKEQIQRDEDPFMSDDEANEEFEEDQNILAAAYADLKEALDILSTTIRILDGLDLTCEELKICFGRIIRNTPEEKILFVSGPPGSGKTSFVDALKATLPGLYSAEDQFLLGDAIGRIVDIRLRRMFTCDEGDHGTGRCLVDSFSNLSKGASQLFKVSADHRKPSDTLYVFTSANENMRSVEDLETRHNQSCKARFGVDQGEDLVGQLRRRINFISFSEAGQQGELFTDLVNLMRDWRRYNGVAKRSISRFAIYGIARREPWQSLDDPILAPFFEHFILAELISMNLVSVLEGQQVCDLERPTHEILLRNQRMRAELFGTESNEDYAVQLEEHDHPQYNEAEYDQYLPMTDMEED